MEKTNNNEMRANNISKVSSTMEVRGTITSKDSIEADGKIFGNVTTTQNFTSSNLTVGVVTADCVSLNVGRIKGNVKSTGVVKLTQDSAIVGNVTCDSINLDGKIKGNINVNGDAVVDVNALIVGDLVANNIKTEQGARVVGKIITRSKDNKPIDVDAEFDLGGDF